jgi:hypothetical protein
MSIIMTQNGWHQLSPFPPVVRIEEAPPRYRGPLPSFDCLAYIANLEAAHNEWQAKRKASMEEA